MKKKFICPFQNDDEDCYTTDDCADCFNFWDCKVGLKECLNNPDFFDYYEDIRDALQDL